METSGSQHGTSKQIMVSLGKSTSGKRTSHLQYPNLQTIGLAMRNLSLQASLAENPSSISLEPQPSPNPHIQYLVYLIELAKPSPQNSHKFSILLLSFFGLRLRDINKNQPTQCYHVTAMFLAISDSAELVRCSTVQSFQAQMASSFDGCNVSNSQCQRHTFPLNT